MGFSVSATFAIFLIGFLVMASLSYNSLSSSVELINDGRRDQHDRMSDELQTDINITSANYDSGSNTLTVIVENIGSIVLDASEIDLLIDGEIKSADYITMNPAKVWIPEETLTITASNVSLSPSRVKVVAENGISDYYSLV